MKSILAAVSAVELSSKDSDVNGLKPVMLIPIVGLIPNRNVLSGTVARNAGFMPGGRYYAQCRETATDPKYGRQFAWNNLGSITPIEIQQLSQASTGDTGVFTVDAPLATASVESGAMSIEE